MIDITHPSKGIINHVFQLFPNDKIINYEFCVKRGLTNCNKKNATRGMDVLSSFLSIKNEDIEAVKKFIERHGFLFPINPNESSSIDATHIFNLINRLNAVIALMVAICEKNVDYKKVLSLTLYLLLSPQITINISNDHSYSSTYYTIGRLWNGVFTEEDGSGIEEMKESHILHVDDTICPPRTSLTYDDYIYAIDPSDERTELQKRKITFLYMSANSVDYYCRLAIDFIYHFHSRVGELHLWNFKGELSFVRPSMSDTEDCLTENEWFNNKFDKQLQIALMTLAKHTLKVEIECNLFGVVTPTLDVESMTPTWSIDGLLAGLYLSIFYMRPDVEMLKKCENPNCENLFRVKTTSAKKNKYCSTKCTNAMAQRALRKRKAHTSLSSD